MANDQPMNVHFLGKEGLIQFTDDKTNSIWLFDAETKTARPFVSEQAFNSYYGGPPASEIAKKSIIKIPSTDLDTSFGDYKLLKNTQGIKNDGTISTPDSTDISDMNLYYGKAKNDNLNKAGFSTVTGYLNLLKNTPNSGIVTDTISEILNDNNLLAFYVNAIAYGGYDYNDIYRDLKKRDLIKAGNTEYLGTVVIDPQNTADEFRKTTEGQAAKKIPALIVPSTLGNFDSSVFDLSIFKLPDDIFKILVPPIDRTSPEFKEEMDKVKSAYYDTVMQQMSAKTEREKAIADYNWDELKDNIEKTYGVRLSQNAFEAWDQISAIGTTYGARGLYESGMHKEAVDNYLQRLRKSNELLREAKATDEEKSKMTYYLNYATPEQIRNDLTDEEKVNWGLKPSAEQADWFSRENLKKLYPNLTDEEIDRTVNAVFDQYGNYRSGLYHNYITGKLDAESLKRQYQQATVLGEKLYEEEKKYEPFEKDAFAKPDYEYKPAEAEPEVEPTITKEELAPGIYKPTTGTVPEGWGVDAQGRFVKIPIREKKPLKEQYLEVLPTAFKTHYATKTTPEYRSTATREDVKQLYEQWETMGGRTTALPRTLPAPEPKPITTEVKKPTIVASQEPVTPLKEVETPKESWWTRGWKKPKKEEPIPYQTGIAGLTLPEGIEPEIKEDETKSFWIKRW